MTSSKKTASFPAILDRQSLVNSLQASQQRLAEVQADKLVADCNLADAKIALIKAESAALLSGTIQGKNEAERKANAQVTLSSEQEALQAAERAQMEASVQLSLAKLEWDLSRELVKVAALPTS